MKIAELIANMIIGAMALGVASMIAYLIWMYGFTCGKEFERARHREEKNETEKLLKEGLQWLNCYGFPHKTSIFGGWISRAWTHIAELDYYRNDAKNIQARIASKQSKRQYGGPT